MLELILLCILLCLGFLIVLAIRIRIMNKESITRLEYWKVKIKALIK